MVSQGKTLKSATSGVGKKWLIITLAGVIWVGPVLSSGIPVIGNLSTSSVAYAASTSAKKLGEEIITSGAVLMKYQYINSTGPKSLANVIRVDLNNKYVKLDVMTGQGNQFTTRQSTGGMAKENGAVAAINGDFLIPAAKGLRWVLKYRTVS